MFHQFPGMAFNMLLIVVSVVQNSFRAESSFAFKKYTGHPINQKSCWILLKNILLECIGQRHI